MPPIRSYAILDPTGLLPVELIPPEVIPAPAPAAHPDLSAHTGLGLAAQADLTAKADALHTHNTAHNHDASYAPTHGHPYEASGAVATHAQTPHGSTPPVHVTLANGATAMGFGTNGSVKVTPTANATYTTTVPVAGTRCTILVLTSGTTSRTITFGTGFKAVSTLATGTTSGRVFAISFLSDGAVLYETGRTAAMTA